MVRTWCGDRERERCAIGIADRQIEDDRLVADRDALAAENAKLSEKRCGASVYSWAIVPSQRGLRVRMREIGWDTDIGIEMSCPRLPQPLHRSRAHERAPRCLLPRG